MSAAPEKSEPNGITIPNVNDPGGMATGGASTLGFTEVFGKVAGDIGTGQNAQNAIIYQTIRWSFLTGVGLSIGVFAFTLFKGDVTPPISIKDTWSTFVPIVTLALGYLFGKST